VTNERMLFGVALNWARLAVPLENRITFDNGEAKASPMFPFRLAPASTTYNGRGGIVEDSINALAQEGHPSDDDYGNQGHQQTILNGGGAGFILEKISDPFQFISLQVVFGPKYYSAKFPVENFRFLVVLFG